MKTNCASSKISRTSRAYSPKPKHYAEDTEGRREGEESEEGLSAGEEFILRGVERDDRQAALPD